MPYVLVKKGNYVIRWGGIEYELYEGRTVMLPKEVIRALFPQSLEDYFPPGTTLTEGDIRNLLSMFVSRWNNAKRIVEDKEENITGLSYENILEFLEENFQVLTDEEMMELREKAKEVTEELDVEVGDIEELRKRKKKKII